MTRRRAEIERLLGELDHCTADELEDQNLDFKGHGRGARSLYVGPLVGGE